MASERNGIIILHICLQIIQGKYIYFEDSDHYLGPDYNETPIENHCKNL